MKDFWKRQARRIDALSLRERAIMFVSLAVALVALTDALVLSPRTAEQKAVATRLRAQAAELVAMRGQLGSGGVAADTPAGRLAQSLAAVRGEQATVDAEIARRLADGSAGARLQELLERVLRRHERLTLLRLATGPAPAASAAGALPLQGVEIAVRGAYPDLTQYVADIERTLPGLRWDEMAVTRGDAGAELRARVALLGDTP